MNSREKLVLSFENSPLSRENKGVSSPFEWGRGSSEPRGMICKETKLNSIYRFRSTLRESSSPNNRYTRLLIPSSKADYESPLPEALGTGKRGLIKPLLIVLFAAIISIFSINTPLSAQDIDPVAASYPQLQEYLRIATEENPELRSLSHLYEAEKERVREVGVFPDPELNIMYDFNPMTSESQLGRFSVSAMQMFPWFGTLNTMKEAQKYSANAEKARIDVRQLEILRDLQITWFDIAEVQEQIRVTELNIGLLRELERLVEIRYETGRATQADILRIQMEEQRLINRIENLKDQLNPLKATFNMFLNREPDTEIETTDSVHPQSVAYTEEQIHELVKVQNPAFDAIEARSKSLDNQNRTAKLSGRPSFGLGIEVMGRDFGPMSMFPDATESVIGMATVRLPIFRSRTRSQQQQITERMRALDFDLHQTENRLAAEVESVLEQIRKSERNLRMLDEELVPRAQQALNILSEEYSVGNARFDELLQIQRELLDLEYERIGAIAEQNRAVVRLESLIGVSPPLKGESAEGAEG